MDRQIPKQVKQARRRRLIIRSAAIAAGAVAAAVLIDVWISDTISLKSLPIGEADRGVIEITVNAGGVLAPLDQQIVFLSVRSRNAIRPI